MQQLGAPPEAVAFSKLLGGDGYMTSFREFGKVDLAQVFFPARANGNWQYFLVNGTPRVVDVADDTLLKRVKDVDLPKDRLYTSLHEKYAELMLWEGDHEFVSAKRRRDGGQQFVFSYNINNACHADWTGYIALVRVDFSPNGKLGGTRLLHVEKKRPRKPLGR